MMQDLVAIVSRQMLIRMLATRSSATARPAPHCDNHTFAAARILGFTPISPTTSAHLGHERSASSLKMVTPRITTDPAAARRWRRRF
jgi:hypothetical protein